MGNFEVKGIEGSRKNTRPIGEHARLKKKGGGEIAKSILKRLGEKPPLGTGGVGGANRHPDLRARNMTKKPTSGGKNLQENCRREGKQKGNFRDRKS